MDNKELEQLLMTPVPEELRRRPVLPRCPYCKRRPELRPKKVTPALILKIDNDTADTVEIQEYEVLPCCSARYISTIEHVTR